MYEPDLQPLVRKQIDAGRLSFTTSAEEAAEFALLCVGTPKGVGHREPT